MLKLFRHKNVTRLVLWLLVILILPAFVLWGTGNIGRSKEKGPTYAGKIDNRKISFDTFAESLADVRCQIMMNYFRQPQVMELLLKNKQLTGKMAWDTLIMESEASRRGIKVSDKEVVGFIRSHPIFLRGGRFDDKFYGYVLRNNMGLEPRDFEETVRKLLAVKKLSDELAEGIKVPDEEALEDYKKDTGKFRISYAMIPRAGERARIFELMEKEKVAFEKACSRLGLVVKETPSFSKSDYLEGIGEADEIVDAAVKLKPGEVSAPVSTRKGLLVFRVTEESGIDEEKFKNVKVEYEKKVLYNKKNAFLEDWLRKREKDARLNIDLQDYEKYYR